MIFTEDEKPRYGRPDLDRPVSNPVKTLIFIMIGAVLVVFTDLVILDGKRYIWKPAEEVTASGDLSIDAYSLQDRHARYMTEGIVLPRELAESTVPNAVTLSAIEPAIGTPLLELVIAEEEGARSITDVLSTIKEEELIPAGDVALQPPAKGEIAKIAIIIDDMGITLRSKLVEVMDGPLTLAYLPYAKNLPERTARAKANGHELMVHIPMQAVNGTLDGGPRVLSSDLSTEEFDETLDWGLSQFEGYAGVNNHMGSRLTQDSEALARMMKVLKAREVYFVDSKTIATSVAADAARDKGVAYGVRDVFLDHEISQEFIDGALRKLERTAREKGAAIAIGHPHKETIDALKRWIPTLAEKGFELVPASALVHRRVAAESLATR